MKRKLIRLNDKLDIRTNVQVSDQVTLPYESTRKLTPEGYLKATAAITRVGVQMYSARDLGGDSDDPVGVFRPPETVFHPETIESIKLKPIVLLHPEEDVDSENHSRLSIGVVGETVERISDDRLGAAIQINDEGIVKKVLSREVEELSLGYDTFIISEEGVFNGQKYFYKMDGPMINNHLAIVPEGRCGDTVKILDKGAKTVNKKQMIKALRDAKVSEDKIKLFMADAKDDAPGDFSEYTKLLVGKDIDMAALIPGIIAELKPTLEELVGSEEFKTGLAKEIAAGMVGGSATPGAEGEGDAGDQEGEEGETETDPAVMDEKIKDGAMKRARLIDMAKPFLKKDDSFDVHKATPREILDKAIEAVGTDPKTLQDKSDDYLFGMLETISQDRKDVENFSTKMVDSSNPESLAAPMTGIEARKKL